MTHASLNHAVLRYQFGAVVLASGIFTLCVHGQQLSPHKQAKDIVAEAIERYRSMTTYRDTCERRYEIEVASGTATTNPPALKTLSLVYKSPNRIALRDGDFAVFSDGQTRWVHQGRLGQFMREPAAKRLNLDEVLPRTAIELEGMHPVAAFFDRPGRSLEETFIEIKSIKGVEPAPREGEPGHWIIAAMEPGYYGDAEDAEMVARFWFSDQTSLLGEVRVDMTAVRNKMSENRRQSAVREAEEAGEEPDASTLDIPTYGKYELVLSLAGIETDGAVEDAEFQFEPAPEDRLVEVFDHQDRSRQAALIGQPAPEFAGLDLDGEPIKLADFRGRVVLLDFWATWCGPCVQAIPHIQAISEQFADRPVTVLGINRDANDAGQRVRNFLTKKGVTFRQVMPGEDKISEKYLVTGIPTTVLIDAQGVLQDIRVGFEPGGEERIGSNIEKLLAGEPLYTPAELEQRRRGETDPSGSIVIDDSADPGPLSLVEPDRFVELARVPGELHSHERIARVDVDGDGIEELICPGHMGDMKIVDPVKGTAERIRLEGIRGNTGISAMEPVKLVDRWHWLIASQRWGRNAPSTSTLALYSPEGYRLWTFEPALPEGYDAQYHITSGDLNGDGTPELIVGLDTGKLRMVSSRGWTREDPKSYLVILDAAGNTLSQRRAGTNLGELSISPAAPGSPPIILAFVDGRVRRFTVQIDGPDNNGTRKDAPLTQE